MSIKHQSYLLFFAGLSLAIVVNNLFAIPQVVAFEYYYHHLRKWGNDSLIILLVISNSSCQELEIYTIAITGVVLTCLIATIIIHPLTVVGANMVSSILMNKLKHLN